MRALRSILRSLTALCSAVVLVLAACGRDVKPITEPGADRPMFAIGVDSISGASIETNQDDYLPGELVNLVMKGWAANEDVHLVMTEDPDTHGDVETTVTVDGNGEWSGPFYDVQPHDLGVTFTLIATGLTSGSSATVVFTDAAHNVRFQTSGLPAGVSVSVTYSGTNNGGNPVSGTVIFTSPGPSANTGLLPASTFTYGFPASFTVGATTYNFSSGSPTSPFTTGASQGLTTVTGTYVAAVVTGTLTIVKDAVPDHDQDFSFSTSGTGLSAFSLDDDADGTLPSFQTFSALTAGAYEVAEDGESGWTLTGISCTANGATYVIGRYTAAVFGNGGTDQFDAGDNVVRVTIAGGSTPSCTFTNTKDASLDIEKSSVGSTAEFDFVGSGGGGLAAAFTRNTGSANPTTTAPFAITGFGDKYVEETAEAGWTLTGISCTANGATYVIGRGGSGAFVDGGSAGFETGDNTVKLTIAAGNTPTCTITNTNNPPVLAAIANIADHPEETEATFTASATDTDPVTYSIASCTAGTYPTGAAIVPATGVFTWTPAENQAPASYCVKVVATAIGGTDDQEVTIGVAEVNKDPVLTVPADFSIKWGNAISGKNASATDPDLDATGAVLNTLTPSLEAGPTGLTLNTTTGTSPITRAISWTPTSGQVGPHTVTVRVTDDGTPNMFDEESFTITVQSHTTTLVYGGANSGQYSDVSQLCATLTDDDASNAGISGKTITFYWDGGSVGTGTTNSSGRACTDVSSNVYTVLNPNGDHTVKAAFAGDLAYDAATDDDNNFNVDAEDATVTPDGTNQNAYQVGSPGGSASFTLKFSVMETYGSEPDANDKALAGSIGNAVLGVSLVPVGGGGAVNPTSCATAVVGSGYGSTKSYTCSFSGVPVETYELKAGLDGTYYDGYPTDYSDVLTVFDPSLGFVTGGGTYLMDGDRVNFGFVGKIVQNKKNSVIKGSLLVIRHKSNGEVVRIKSNVFDGLAVGTNAYAGTATFSGKANYSVNGVTDPTNYDFTGYVKDGGTPGAGVDQFSLFHGKGDAAAGYEVRTSPSLALLKAVASVKTLTGGNLQVP